MTTNPSRITVASYVRIWLAVVGTPVPVDLGDPATGWYDVGLTTPESLKFTEKPTFEDIEAHQSDYPVRTIQKTDEVTLEVDLMEWSGRNFQAAFGGGTITEIGSSTPKIYKFTPPALGARAETAAIVDVVDGAKHYRIASPRAQQKEGVNLELKKSPNSILPLRMTVLGGAGVEPWYLITNDPAFAPV